MNKKTVLVVLCVVGLGIGGWALFGQGRKDEPKVKIVKPFMGRIESSITATGTVQPQNRLEIKPPIAGRVDKILVEEGQKVKAGEILALMSSTDRAALLDAARLQNKDSGTDWEDVYKPTPLLAPIDGEVIVKAVNPGQTVTSIDAVLVLSDRLIVQAQIDETDIGKVKVGQAAVVSLDAYPEIEVKAKVDHVYYESKTVNNVTIYQVDILPEVVPDVFRSGMSANVRVIEAGKDNILLIPSEVVKEEDGKKYVLVGQGRGTKPVKKEIQLGISDDTNVEVISGLTLEDRVLQKLVALGSFKSAKSRSNPFMPTPPGGARRGGGH